MANKGAKWEREFCTKLSEWWTNGERTDIFWRSTTSGARATTRSKKGLTTKGHYGDVTAIDPIGQPLMDLLSIEAKVGYNKHSFHALIDRPQDAAFQMFEQFWHQAWTAREQAKTYAWMIVWKRDRREAMCYVPSDFAYMLVKGGIMDAMPIPWVSWCCEMRCPGESLMVKITGFPLSFWWDIEPKKIKDLAKAVKGL